LPTTPRPGAPATSSHTKGPITRAFLEVLEVLLCGFHNSRSGACFPSYEAIAAKAECHRSTVAEALKALEWAGRAHLEAGQRLAGDCGGTVR
jgi:hypothetical protein